MTRTQNQKFITQADFARIVEVSRQRISTAIKHGKLDGALVGSGRARKIDLEKGLAAWAANIAPIQQIGGRAQQRGPKESSQEQPAKIDGKKKNINQLTLSELQILQARYKAIAQKVDLDEKLGRVISIDQVNREFFDIARLTRDAILAVPDKLSAILAAESSERRINTILTEHFIDALENWKLTK